MPGSINIGQEEGADYLTGSPMNQLAARYQQKLADLMTIVDFMDAVNRDAHYPSTTSAAHDLAHRLIDEPDREFGFMLAKVANWDDRYAERFGPAWPDVRRRMLDLLERVQSGATVWERGR